ncbi:MAG: hypothetical protein A2297_06790 [Elusimicrobia bacterium RIFOXYB2_FULL_48_7]|nr:MAG: hypothetical protein A2297_06790 [Elusimicrobia bacterium RIFOXYB2_FULL_48_7]
MKVPYSYLMDQFSNPDKILADIREEITKKAELTIGPQVDEFERQFAALCGAKYAVGVASGTDALFLSLKALGIGAGDEVITAPNTFIATVGAIVASGAKPVYVDIDKEQFNIDANLIEKAITKKTKAIMPVHYAGSPANMKKVMEIAKKHKLLVVEDACQAISASIDGKIVGNFGSLAGFSLHPLKNLNVWGDGGLIVTNSKELREKLILLRNHGLKNRDEVEIYGYNSRLDTIHAIVGLNLIKQAEFITNTRIANAKKIDEGLADLKEYITIPERLKNVRHVYHLYIIRVKNRDGLLKYLIDNGVEAKVHYPIPMHLQNCSKNHGLKYKKGDFPICEAQCKEIISLPVHQHLSSEQVQYTIETVRKFYKK